MLLDIGAGILWTIFVAKIFGMPLTAAFLTAGIIFSLLVDIDFILLLVIKNKTALGKGAYNHRNLLHYPLLYVPSGTMILFLFSTPLAVLFAFCSLTHFLHDSIGIGWGIQWLYPFSKNHWTFFYRYQPNFKERLPKKIMYIEKHEDIEALAEKYGDPDWIKNIYGKLHPYALIEFLVFVISLIVLFLYMK